MVVHACKCCTQDVEAWGLRIPNQPGLHKEPLPQKTVLHCLLCETENRPKGIWALLREIHQVPEITELKLLNIVADRMKTPDSKSAYESCSSAPVIIGRNAQKSVKNSRNMSPKHASLTVPELLWSYGNSSLLVEIQMDPLWVQFSLSYKTWPTPAIYQKSYPW